MSPQRVVELVSPTSDLGVDLFKAELFDDDFCFDSFSSRFPTGVFCLISDLSGAVKSSNVKLDVPNVFQLFRSTFMQSLLEDFYTRPDKTSQTLLSGHIERIHFDGIDSFAFVKLQYWVGDEERLLIWTMTKANIVPTDADNDDFTFTLNDSNDSSFTFSKLSFSFGVDADFNLVNFPVNLAKYLMPAGVELKTLPGILEMEFSSLKDSIRSRSNGKFTSFMDSFDALPASNHHSEEPIFIGSATLKSSNTVFKFKVYPSVNYKDNCPVFPISMTYDNSKTTSSSLIHDFRSQLSERFEFIELLSHSDHSIVYLAKDGSNQIVVVKKT